LLNITHSLIFCVTYPIFIWGRGLGLIGLISPFQHYLHLKTNSLQH